MIYRTVPLEVERIWGALTGRSGASVGEIWHLYDGPRGSSRLLPLASQEGRGGPEDETDLEGLRQAGAMETFREAGDSCYPLIVKTLHTAAPLSVQVHPGASPDAPGRKDETWLVLDAAPDSWIICGIREGVTPASFEEVIRSGGSPADMMLRHQVSSGDIFHLPAGSVHSLGAGLTVLEIQSSFDVTYRLYDWDRMGSDGRPRPLHLEEGMASIDWARSGGCMRIDRHGHSGALPLGDGCGRSPGYSIEQLSEGELMLDDCALLYVLEGMIVPGRAGIGRTSGVREGNCLLADSNGGLLRLEGTALRAAPRAVGGGKPGDE